MTIGYSTKGLELTNELEKYANGKVVRLRRRIPRRLRAHASCKVAFVQVTRKGTKFSTCEVTLALDRVEFKAKETTLHMYAALDVAAVYIEQQLRDYVRTQRHGLLRRRPHTK